MVVVPAHAGTHTPRLLIFAIWLAAVCYGLLQWLWVPAFAGTT